MELIKLTLFTLILGFSLGSARADDTCVVHAEDPVIQQFFRAKGFEVDADAGDFRVEFEVTCEAVDKKKEKSLTSEIHKTTTKIEVFNQYEKQRVVYHSEASEQSSGRVESSFVVPCADTRQAKLKLLESALVAVKDITCNEEQ
jgi:hypothetical protein